MYEILHNLLFKDTKVVSWCAKKTKYKVVNEPRTIYTLHFEMFQKNKTWDWECIACLDLFSSMSLVGNWVIHKFGAAALRSISLWSVETIKTGGKVRMKHVDEVIFWYKL